jgi:hypothetical protein
MSNTTRRDDFRAYLEKSGLADSIERVICQLYDEFDEHTNPLDYIKQYLGTPKDANPAELRASNEKLKKEISELETRVQTLRNRKGPA